MIRRRNETDLADLFANYLPFTYMLTSSTSGLPSKPIVLTLTSTRMRLHAHRFGDRFRNWLNRGTRRLPPSANYTRLIRFNWGVLRDWDIWYDRPEFAITFGHVLKFNERLLRIEEAVLCNMHEVSRSQRDKNGRFLGTHLRTERDAWSSWQHTTSSCKKLQTKASQGGFGVAYLAIGNATEARRFATDAETSLPGMKVVGKRDLLSGEGLNELDALTFDQQGTVDFVVLLGSDFFVGTMPGIFLVYTAVKRHLRTGGLYTRPYRVATEGDALSYVGGNYESISVRRISTTSTNSKRMAAATTIADLERISADRLKDLILAQAQQKIEDPNSGSKVAIVDVRDDDHVGGHIKSSLHFPSGSLDATMPTLLRQLADKDTVVFHCALSRERGPSAALRYLREREAQQAQQQQAKAEGKGVAEGEKGAGDGNAETELKVKQQKVYVLDRGFVGWQEVYGPDETLTEAWRKELWEQSH
ncbi:hypothetical protein DL770_001938 [Monosporascus sp. CRB-9-2]|nr:hypothetical protein DL770_001938 [Monosporascus sp. CRB-9-2]